jgi:3',5'-cyclic AMP phosphodiesterase CpdA
VTWIRPSFPHGASGWALLAAVGSVALTALPAAAEPLSGRVYVDSNRSGAWEPGEAPLTGIAVTNGREIAQTDAEGRYQLPPGSAFVSLSRPAGYTATRWYANEAANFGLVPSENPADFFFVQVSDAHVFDRVGDFQEFSIPDLPWWLPAFAADWLTLFFLDGVYESTCPDGVAAAMRSALLELAEGEGASPERRQGLAELGDVASLRAYRTAVEEPGSPLADVAGAARRAFEEVASLGPAFIVSTGDLVLEGNSGSAEAVERWLGFYQSLTRALPMPVYNTIGNNEIAGNENPDFDPGDPGYGKRSFQKAFGPTHYSFDRGSFHFIALDTHRPDPSEDKPQWWSFASMDEEVRAWLEADLMASRGRVPVVLNHEPFHLDPEWPMDGLEPADDAGLFARFAVPYVLSGHTHWNSFVQAGATTHITTGALSGMRWILPEDVHPRGYRLFWAQGSVLHSAWKRSGEPVVAYSEGARQPDAAVIVAADAGGPFESVVVSHAGQYLDAERWGDYFLRVPKPPDSGPLVVDVVDAAGEQRRIVLPLN